MRTPEQVRWDFVQQWLNKAKHDLNAAEVLHKSEIESFEITSFHAQQAAEKFIKAILVRHQVEFPKTHDIAKLRNLILKIDKVLFEKLEPADILTPYGVEFRYPGDLPDLTQQQAENALQVALQMKQIILNHLNAYLVRGRPPDPESAN